MVKTLYQMNKGEKGKILLIKGGRGKILRLAEMGLIPGEEVVLLQKSIGPVIVKVKDTNLALGRGIAESILVEVETNEKEN
ncbi:MAG: ferrous iron transport protein A [Dictyoglomus sp. NZ13-RE01]|nr:MAG: ferrous iron transport protein A [Dictyoglomus sp. NZ13-RE01]